MKFCNNNKIIDYNWLSLFEVCNRLQNEGIKYNIYLNFIHDGPERGPFLYYDNKIMYFDKSDITHIVTEDHVDFANDPNFLLLEHFIYLTYSNDNSHNKYNFKNDNSTLFLDYYMSTHDIESINIMFCDYTDLDINKYYGTTLLYTACVEGHNEIVKLLLSHPNIDVNKDNKGATPLYVGCSRGHIEIVNSLLTHTNIDVNKDFNGKTPLINACEKGHNEIVKLLLLQRNIVVNKHFNGKTPSQIAKQNNCTIIPILLEAMVIGFP